MDEAIPRTRYPRYRSISGRRKKKHIRETNTFIELLIRQILISLIILLIAAAIRNINTPFTNFLTIKIKTVLAQNIETADIYQTIEKAVQFIVNNDLFKKYTKITEDKSNKINESIEQSIKKKADTGETSSSSNDTEDKSSNNVVYDNERSSSIVSRGDSVVDLLSGKYTFIPPVNGIVGSAFGERINPISKKREFHKGIDIEADMGTSIKAVLGGKILFSETLDTFGKCIKIQHDDGLISIYAHCSVLLVKAGQKVKQGDIIARVGSTGASSGPHLHFEILNNQVALNPLYFINLEVKNK